MLIGAPGAHLGQSALLAEAFGIEAGDAPPVDLAAERRHGDFVRANRALIGACSDLSDGGLALAAFEMAEGAGIGVTLDEGGTPALFGEDQARYLVACSAVKAELLQAAGALAGVPVAVVGAFGGNGVRFGGEAAEMAELSALLSRGLCGGGGLRLHRRSGGFHTPHTPVGYLDQCESRRAACSFGLAGLDLAEGRKG